MTTSSSLNASVSALNANAVKLASISDNIANSSTTGYKRSDTDFESLVTANREGAATGVTTSSKRLIDQAGVLISTARALDLSARGRGMLPVTSLSAIGRDDGRFPLKMVTTGSFDLDKDGILRTNSGHVLLGWPTDRDGNVPAQPRDTTGGLIPIKVDTNEVIGQATTAVSVSFNLPASEAKQGSSGDTLPMAVEYYGNLGNEEALNISLTPTFPNDNTANQWRMVIQDSATNNAVVGEYILRFDNTRPGGGTLANVTTISGGNYNPVTGSVNLNIGGGPLELTIGQYGDPEGATQFAGIFSSKNTQKDGLPAASIKTLEVDESGYVKAKYDTGFEKTVFQIPLVDVPNINGLKSVENQAYEVSSESGDFFLWDAGKGPTSGIFSFTLEESTTDIAQELTSLIKTQRAYSSNAKVIQTVDEMIQEATNIKR